MNAEEVFHKAMEIVDLAERAAYLERACRADGKLRAEVEALLKAHERAGDFLESPAMDAAATLDGAVRLDGPGTRIGHYELLNLIGEGGMGLVYLAEQKEPIRRKVALKIIKPGMDSRQVVARFEAERQALALLDHPNIAHVFDAGCTETGRPYFVMEYVKGLPITHYCDHNKVTIEQRLRLFEQVCEAVHHAHQKGIIHRDLKPSNILVSVHGDRAVPKIIDFGIAKAITQPLTDKTFVTFQGQLLGTPEYMSPEQVDFAAQDIDTRSDIYSLGVVLYELLAGVLPFEEESFARAGLAEIQQTIREQEPASPSIRLTNLGERAKTIAASRGTQVVPLARRLHRELEWIPLKAMRKDRCRRYRSASEMADDIRNYLTGLPLLAGPETTIYRVQKFVHKHAGSVATVALVALAVVLGLIISTVMYSQAEKAREKEALARAQETAARVQAQEAQKVAQEQRALAVQAEQATKQKAEELRRSLYVTSIQLADAKYHDGNTGRVRELLDACPRDLRAWEWDRLNYTIDQSVMTLRGHEDDVWSLALSPDGTQVASGSIDGSVRLWDWRTGAQLATLRTSSDPVYSVAFSPDGRRLASAGRDRVIRIYDVDSREEAMALRGHAASVCSVAFSPDGRRLASSGDEATIRIWDLSNGEQLMALRSDGGKVFSVRFDGDGDRLASAGGDGTVTVWDPATGEKLMTLKGHKGEVLSVAFSPDGKYIASAGGADIKLWNAATGKELASLRGHANIVNSIAYDPNGKYIVSSGVDNVIKLWDVSTRGELMTLHGHYDGVSSALFSLDARKIISASWDRTIKVWDIATCPERMNTRMSREPTYAVAFSPDGRRIASGSRGGAVKIWDVQTGAELMTLSGHQGRVWQVVFTPDGQRIISGAEDGTVKIWDSATGKEIKTVVGPENTIWPGAFRPDAKCVACGTTDGAIMVCDAITGAEIRRLPDHHDSAVSLAYSLDGSRIISADRGGTVKLWDAESGDELMVVSVHEGPPMTCTGNAKYIIAGFRNGLIRIWDAGTGGDGRVLSGQLGYVMALCLSPDGKRLFSGSSYGDIKVWDLEAGMELMNLDMSEIGIFAVALSPDGRTIVAGGRGGIVMWETTEPPGGYGLRQIAASARQLVDRLYAENGLYRSVAGTITEDRTLNVRTRDLALQIAHARKWEDVDKLKNEAWQAVISPGKDLEVYRAALEKAQKANGWEPNDPAVLATLGAARYRVGLYEDALKTLTKADKIRTSTDEKPEPVNLAFTAMSLEKLGRTEEAEAALTRLREVCKTEQFSEDMEVQALLAEAEELIEGKKP